MFFSFIYMLFVLSYNNLGVLDLFIQVAVAYSFIFELVFLNKRPPFIHPFVYSWVYLIIHFLIYLYLFVLSFQWSGLLDRGSRLCVGRRVGLGRDESHSLLRQLHKLGRWSTWQRRLYLAPRLPFLGSSKALSAPLARQSLQLQVTFFSRLRRLTVTICWDGYTRGHHEKPASPNNAYRWIHTLVMIRIQTSDLKIKAQTARANIWLEV